MKKLDPITQEQWEGVCEFNRTILDDFITNSTELSPKSRHAYFSNLRIWFIWVKDNLGNKSELDIRPLEYKKYQNWLMNRGCSSADINNKRAAISSLNNYIEIYYHDDYPMFRNFINKSIKRPPKAFVHEKKPLTKSEFNHLVDVLRERGDWQKVAYLLFTFDTGCRRAESHQLRKDIINATPIVKKKTVVDADGCSREHDVVFYKTHEIRCKGAGDTGKVRRFTFGEPTMQALKKWVEVRGEDDCEFMFVTKHDGVVAQCSLTAFNCWAHDVFAPIIGRRCYPHQFRSSRASQLVLEEGIDIKVAQKLLGHESVTTTEIYVVRDDTDDLDELYMDADDDVIM